jgi:hypothetical protein
MSTSFSHIPEITVVILRSTARMHAAKCGVRSDAEAFHDPSLFQPARRALAARHLRPWHRQEVAGDSPGDPAKRRGEPEVEQEADS